MRIPTTAQVERVAFLAAITGFLGTRYWVESRTLRAVDMPVSLAPGIVSTGPFNLNFNGSYSIPIGEEQGGNSRCNVGLETGEYHLSVDFPSTAITGWKMRVAPRGEILPLAIFSAVLKASPVVTTLGLKSCLTRAVWMQASRACTS
jgi:hypothetical protein